MAQGTKPLFTDKIEETSAPISTNFLEQDNTMWEVYYNAGSVTIVLVVIFIVDMEQAHTVAANEHLEEESIPHSASMANENSNTDSNEEEIIINQETGLNLPTA
ncbi:hypothetical protein EDD18DRAFT_1108642 [Armillaria luteobubalina]|uniref:Uncharacterized protein n=1 Tax=Armillaria luteobubalina TaxID=153913 RepID=A0AA39TK86_9AGAR|nr:hypothetical protein EDD18DRAFT_1108642 [Armillaria luteobubalina]